MAERAQDTAALAPSHLLRRAAGTADRQRDWRTGRQIERAAILVHGKTIRDQLHGRRRCKNLARADRVATRGIGRQTRQFFQIE